MNKTSILLLLAIGLLFASCGPSQRELAVRKMSTAKQLAAQGDTTRAIAFLDSIKVLFPKAKAQIQVAKNLKNEYYNQLIDARNIELVRLDSTLGELESSFRKEKTEFDKYAQYVHKRQTFQRSWDRSFLQVHLDERGEMYLSSNYMGEKWLEHTGIRVYDGKLQAKSEKIPLDDPLNHRSDFLDYMWEKVSYMNGKADSVINFIADNPTLDFKCVFLGTRYYYILLEDYDVQAVVDARNLSRAILRKKQLEQEIKLFKSKLK